MSSRSPGPGSKAGRGRGRGRGRGTTKQPIRSPGSESETRKDGGVPRQRPEDCIFVGDLVVYKTQCLGGGAFGSVFKGTFGGQPCAVKVLNHLATQLTSPFPAAGATQDKDLERFNKECRLLESHNHRNIVRHMSTLIEPTSNLPVLVMELMDENLTKFLGQPASEPSTLLSLQLQISLSCDVACGLQYLHSNNIVHQDLCSDNVLLKHEGSQLIAKVSDFGISRIVDPDNLTRSLRTVSHRDAYMPPIPPSSDSSIYDTSLDIFSFGVVTVQIVMKVPTLAHPRDRDSLVQKIEPSHPLRKVIVYCLHKDKGKRPKTSEVCHYLNDLLNTREEKLKDVQLFSHEKAVSFPLESSAESTVTLEISFLPPQTTVDEIEAYFEKQGDNVEVLSTVNLGNGNAKVEVSGLTSEELEKLQKQKHKISEQLVHVKVSVDNATTSLELPQPNVLLDTLEVTGLPSNADSKLLKMYFESPRLGSHDDAVEKCFIVVPGTAHVKFQSPKVAAQVLSVSEHTICGSKLQLKYVTIPDPKESGEQYDSNKLLIHQIPQDIDEDYLQLFLEGTLKMDSQDQFVVEVRGESAMITFLNAQFSYEDLVEMTSKIGSKPLKGVILQAELCKVVNSIRVREVTKNYTEDYFQLYFESHKRSGGGPVTSVQLLGNGEAIVTFQGPKVVESVIHRSHPTFGEKVVVEREDFKTVPQANLPPTVTISIDPLVTKSLQKDPRGLKQCIQNLKVDVTIDEKDNIILITHTTHTIAGWEQEAEQLASSYVHSNYKTLEITFPTEATNELMQYVEEDTSLASILSQESLLLKAAGDPTAISVLQTRADEICSAYVQTSDKVELTIKEYDFFTQVKALQIANSHSDVSIQYDFSNHAIILQGSARSVAQFKQCLPEHLAHDSVMVQLDPLIIHYFSTDNGRQQLNDFIQNKKCPVAIHFQQVSPSTTPSQLVLRFLCDPSQTGLAETMSRDLQQITSAKSQPLNETFARKLPEFEEEYQQLCQDLQTQQHIEIFPSDNKVTVAGFNKDVCEAIESIKKFVQDKCNVTSQVEVKRGIWRLFCGPMQKRWQSDIVAQCNRNSVELTELEEDDDRMLILVKGDATIVAEICQVIYDTMKSVVRESISISHPGSCKYFQKNEHAVTLLAGIEKTEQVCIEKSVIDDSISDDAASPGATKFTKVCTACTQEMKQILLYVGDITEFDKADVIVNAANGDLQHAGGVAGAIADKGGPIIQQESSQHVRRCGRLDDGDVWLTTKVGALPCKALIHAVGPRWSGGHSKEDLLSKALTQSLQAACEYRSIAFPAISSGIFGFPIDRCAQTLVGAAVTFCERNSLSELQEIYFVVFKQSDAQAFVKALETRLPQENIIMSLPQKSSYPIFRPPRVGTPISEVKSATEKKTEIKVASLQDCIILRHGSLTEIKADVYVNTTNGDLDLAQGGVAQALSKAAGPALQAECTKKAPISVGDIAVTGGGRLPCQYILHTVAAKYRRREKQAEKELQELVNKCLKECTELRMTSIAFPAIGTGNLGYPNDVVARVMVEAVSTFLSTQKNSTLSAVYLVTFLTETHRAFQQEFAKQKLTPETSYSLMSSLSQKITVPRRSRKRSSRHAAATQSISVSSQQAHQLGTIQVQVINGDITEDSSDAVVNPTSSELKLNNPGVSGALLRKGGEELQKACNTLTSQGVKLEEGKVVHTAATGALKCRYVFHILFESKDSKKFVKTITACLHKAEELKCNSIAFPAVGTGTIGYSPDAAAKGMMKAIDQFATSKVTHITCVHVVLLQQDIYQTFVSVFNDPESFSHPGLLKRTKEFVGSFLPAWTASTEDDGNSMVSHPASPSFKRMMYGKVELLIYGETQKAVKRAVEKLQSFIKAQFITDTVNDPNVDQLSQSEMQKLEDTSEQMHVELDINFPQNLICLKGDRGDVHKMRSCIIETLAELEKRIFRQREAENMQKLVQWKRMDSQETEYDEAENYEMELAYSAKKPSYTHHDTVEHYTVDFKKMEEIDHNSQDRFPVVRVDLIKLYQEGIEKPSHWDPMPTDPQTGKEAALHCVDLAPGSKEYNEVLQEFNKSMTQGAGKQFSSYAKIVKIQRIQNPMLYAQYIAKKKVMEKHNLPGFQNEQRLFHGTPADICPKINQQGFNRSFAGKNATAIGRGVYFARNASYSAQSTYSPPDKNGQKYIYFARVLVGEVAVGDRSMIVPPPKDPKDPTILFDSVVDNISNPVMHVVFFDAQTYPEYLIVFS